MSFGELLILFAFAIFAVVVSLLAWSKEKFRIVLRPRSRPKPKWIFYFYLCLIGVFLLFSFHYWLIGQRSSIWFYVYAIVGILSLYFSGSQTGYQRKVALLAVICFGLIQSVTPIVENRGIIFGPDQWRDLYGTKFITESGTFQNSLGTETGFYSFVPLFNVINAVVSEVLGCSAMLVFTIMLAILFLVSSLSVYAFMSRLTGSRAASLLAVILLGSIPRLALVQALPSIASLSLGLLLVLLLIRGSDSPGKGNLPTMAILVLVIGMIHPVGLFPVLGICLGLILVNHFTSQMKLRPHALSFIESVFAICLLIPLGYWSVESTVLASVVHPLVRFGNILMRFRYSPSGYVPQYQATGFEIYSLAWAVPVALSAAGFVIMFGATIRTHDKMLQRDFRWHTALVAGLEGLMLILGAFLSVLLSPGAALERYINTIGYALLIISASLVLAQMIWSSRKAISVFAILILFATVVVGSSSPDWAPLEQPEFGAFRSTYAGYVEAKTIVTLLPNNSRLFEDHDIPISGVGKIGNVSFITPESYQTTRLVIDDFKRSSFKPFDPELRGAFVILKTDEISNSSLLDKYVNFVYDSGRHIVVLP
jgi:hypothetical protein